MFFRTRNRSESAWLDTPPKKHLKTVVVLPDNFSIVKDKRAGHGVRSDDQHYFLLHNGQQAGSAAVVVFPKGRWRDIEYEESRWIDVVYLEPEYRGKNYMRSLLWFVLRDYTYRPLFLDSHKSNLNTYLVVGFVRMDDAQLAQYKDDLERHRRSMNYSKPYAEYVPLILK